MAGTALTSIADMTDHVLASFKDRGKFQTIETYQSSPLLDLCFEEGKVQVDNGKRIEMRIIPTGNGSFRWEHELEPRTYSPGDVRHMAYIDWRRCSAVAEFVEGQMSLDSGESAIVNYLRQQEYIALKDFAEGVELSMLRAPANSGDTKAPHGLLWWARMLDGATLNYTGGFLGQTCRYHDGTSGGTTLANIDASTYSWWKNWAGHRTDTLGITTLESLRKINYKIGFKAAKMLREFVIEKANKWRTLMSIDDKVVLDRIVDEGPDNRNGDYSPFAGQVRLFRNQIITLPTLDDHAQKPIIVVDFARFRPVVEKGNWMKWHKTRQQLNPEDLFTKRITSRLNYICDNPRKAIAILHLPLSA